MNEFKKRFFGKWALSGEYTVLRSGPALVYPLPHYYMDFHYKNSDQALKIKRRGEYQAGLEFAVTPLLDKALKQARKKRGDLKGVLTIEGFIPFGAGLGASSTMCAGIACLFLHKAWIKKEELKNFASSLEDFFHGKSSGMDVAVVLENKALLYQQGEKPKYIPQFKSKPLLFLSYSGGRSSTAVGVSQVRRLFDESWSQAEQVDKKMIQSVELCSLALKEKDKNKSRALLAQALSLGEECFHKWKLISYDLERHIEYLKNKGALAVKPTGSGLGGHVISLWDKKPPAEMLKNLISLEL